MLTLNTTTKRTALKLKFLVNRQYSDEGSKHRVESSVKIIIQSKTFTKSYIYIYIVQSADMRVSAFYASSVQLGTHPHVSLHCIYTRALTLTKRMRYNTTQPSGLCIIAFRHLLRFARVLNNTEVKGHYSTICRHACFGLLHLISAAWYTSTCVAALYLYT